MQPLRPILVVEDSHEDFLALERAFHKHELQNLVLRAEDGDQALDYLRGYGKAAGWPGLLPAIVLLDLNLPGTDGREVLEVMKQDARLHDIPVIIFSSSASDRDVADCYRLGANSYLTKPVEYATLEHKVHLALSYWLESTELPRLT